MVRGSLLLSLVVAGGAIACGGDSFAPFEPEIVNTADDFQFQATDVTLLTTSKTYPWTNAGTQATVNHSTTTAAGTARLIVRDAAGATVYDSPLSPSLNEPTAVGQAGTWTVEVRLNRYTGTMNFRLQRL